MGRLRALGSLVSLSVLVVACSKPSSERAPSASATAVPDLTGYCTSICRKATECGASKADKLASSDPSKSAITEAHREAPELTRACTEKCAADAPTGELAQKLIRAQRCTEQDSCDTFGACLRDAAGLIGANGKDPG